MKYTTLIGQQSFAQLIGDQHVRDEPVRDPQVGYPSVVIIDCRFDLASPSAGRQAYLAAHIPSAQYADLNIDLAASISPHTGRHPLPDPQILAGVLTRFGVTEATQVIVYDGADGAIAARAWWLLRWLGHSSVAVLDGGFKAWVAAGGGVQSGAPAPAGFAGARFVPRVDEGAVLTTAQLMMALHDPRRLLIDARSPERYAGIIEPLDSVAGHIPGAVNHPFFTNLSAEGSFLPPEELRRRWLERLGNIAPGAAIAMCGSGVTACHNLLALEIANLPGTKLYAGSWSEWVRDSNRAVVRTEATFSPTVIYMQS